MEDHEIHNIHDKFARKLLSDLNQARDILQTYLPPETVEAIDLSELKREQPSFIDKEFDEHFADLLFSAPVRGGEGRSRVLILPEHKSQVDESVLLQLGTYLMLAWRREWKDAGRPSVFQLSPPVLVVLHHSRKPWDGPRDFSEQVETLPGMAHCVPHFGFTLIDLADTPVERIRGNPVTRAAFEAMKRVSDGTMLDGIANVMRHLQELPLTQVTREWIRTVVFYAGRAARLPQEAIQQSLKPFIPKSEVDEMVLSFLEEAEAKGEINAIVTVLQVRFGEVPESVRERLTSITDLERLTQLAAKAASVNSLEEFIRSL